MKKSKQSSKPQFQRGTSEHIIKVTLSLGRAVTPPFKLLRFIFRLIPRRIKVVVPRLCFLAIVAAIVYSVWGIPTVRLYWESRAEEEDMYYSRSIMLTGQRTEHFGYVPLVYFSKGDVNLPEYLLERADDLLGKTKTYLKGLRDPD